VKEEEGDKVAALLRDQRLNATSDDASDTSGFNAAFMASLNDHTAWAGNVDDVITLSICESGWPLIDLRRDDGEAGPRGTVEEEPTDGRWDPYEHFSQQSEASSAATATSLVLV
jgi:hypothetical protein